MNATSLMVLIIIAVLALCLLIALAVVIAFRDVFTGSRQKDKNEEDVISLLKEVLYRYGKTSEHTPNKPPALTEAYTQTEPAQAEPSENPPPAAYENLVAFQKAEQLTFRQLCRTLPAEKQEYLEQIVRHVEERGGVRRFEHAKHCDWKSGRTLIVKIKISRGNLCCGMITDVFSDAYDASVKVEYAPSFIKVTDAASVAAVIRGIDYIFNSIDAEKEKKRLQRNELRRKRVG